MTKEEYLRKKEQQKNEDELKTKRRDLCLKCFRPKKTCYCSNIESFDTKTKFVLLMHPMEFKSERVGTGRLTHLSLKNSEIIMDVDFTNNKKVNDLINDEKYFPMVMYPGADAINVSNGELTDEKLNGKIPLVFVVDATWYLARKMMTLSQNLRNLKRVSFNVEIKSRFIIKEQPLENCISTIEAVYSYLDEANKANFENLNNAHVGLLNVFQKMVDFQIACTNDESIPSYRKHKFRKPEERIKRGRWKKKNLFR